MATCQPLTSLAPKQANLESQFQISFVEEFEQIWACRYSLLRVSPWLSLYKPCSLRISLPMRDSLRSVAVRAIILIWTRAHEAAKPRKRARSREDRLNGLNRQVTQANEFFLEYFKLNNMLLLIEDDICCSLQCYSSLCLGWMVRLAWLIPGASTVAWIWFPERDLYGINLLIFSLNRSLIKAYTKGLMAELNKIITAAMAQVTSLGLLVVLW